MISTRNVCKSSVRIISAQVNPYASRMLKRTRSHSQPIITMATRIWLQENGNRYEPKRSKSEPRKPQVVYKRASPEDSSHAATPSGRDAYSRSVSRPSQWMILCLGQILQWSVINECSGRSPAACSRGQVPAEGQTLMSAPAHNQIGCP